MVLGFSECHDECFLSVVQAGHVHLWAHISTLARACGCGCGGGSNWFIIRGDEPLGCTTTRLAWASTAHPGLISASVLVDSSAGAPARTPGSSDLGAIGALSPVDVVTTACAPAAAAAAATTAPVGAVLWRHCKLSPWECFCPLRL